MQEVRFASVAWPSAATTPALIAILAARGGLCDLVPPVWRNSPPSWATAKVLYGYHAMSRIPISPVFNGTPTVHVPWPEVVRSGKQSW